ncbi:hypothetical protein F7725_026305 [Dissostichus mawsoni]|uniref:Uncharacterized protein n=1 Tax=Dissostichus mawsoni TaxID=36200 RepID=A0A7J5X6M2_DISMA|nr:hypothetical protein F7725_026305 [Dissostichus mawsoni]
MLPDHEGMQIKIDGLDTSSYSQMAQHTVMDIAPLSITDTTTGDEANADNDSADAKHSQHSAAILETDDQMSSGLVSPATSYYTREYDEHIIEHSETSSLADPCSPSPGASGTRSIDSGDRPAKSASGRK